MLHELTSRLVREQGPRFYVEDLRILNMTKNHRLARAILEQTWGAFVTMLAYKAEDAGGWVRKVPAHRTSQRCSACGALPSTPVGLGVRTYRCAGCRNVVDRDVNAAKNILSVGLALDWPGGEPPVCREAEDERSARPETPGRIATARNSTDGRSDMTGQPFDTIPNSCAWLGDMNSANPPTRSYQTLRNPPPRSSTRRRKTRGLSATTESTRESRLPAESSGETQDAGVAASAMRELCAPRGSAATALLAT